MNLTLFDHRTNTVLTRAGISFQYYDSIFVASYVTREINVGNSASADASAGRQKISFVRMKDYVLSNTAGIEHTEGYSIASKERAFLDRIYKSKDYHFDHLDVLDWDKVFEILPIYNNKRMDKKVKKYFKKYKTDNFDIDYQSMLFPEDPNIVYLIGFDDFGKFKPFYVGESRRNIGRFGDYISAQFSAQTDFKVSSAVKCLKELNKNVIIKYRNSENRRKEQDIIIRELKSQGIKLLNDVSGYNYRTADKEDEIQKIKSFINEIAM